MNYETFLHPDPSFRELMFWAWNDDLEVEELRRQVGLMAEAGLGGFFMQAREGLRTGYLGPKWMACVRACVEQASKQGLHAWLYDEDRWPSGFAGGLSVAPEPEHRMQALVCKVDNKPALLAERTAAFVARQRPDAWVDVRPLDAEEIPVLEREEHRLLQFYVRTAPLGNPRFNDYSYLDLLNPEAVRAFLHTTHEAYAHEFADALGQTIPGIFSDEPCIHFHPSVPWSRDLPLLSIPWSSDFSPYFFSQNGYELIPYLPSLFFNLDCEGDGVRRSYYEVRYHYWRTVTQRFVESYSRQIYAWCDRHGLAYTGHTMGEDTLLSQIRWIGAAMPHYEYMHIPGVDNLGRSLNRFAGTVLAMKQVDSVASQLGKQRTLCENYGCTGQDFALAGHKRLGDWASVMGINLHNAHMALYSMRGSRKRDYPPNLFYQQPWWSEYSLLADYFARLSYAMSQGQRVVDILVIHPLGSAWALYQPDASFAVDELDHALDELGRTLLQHQRDFHLGDEMLMAKYARVSAESSDQPRLQLGAMAYRLVIVPAGITLAASTAELLHAFAAAGGVILALEPIPRLVEGCESEIAPLPAKAQVLSLKDLPAALDNCLPFDVRIAGQPAIWVHHRQHEGTDWYFCVNIAEEDVWATMQVRGRGQLEVWDLLHGDVSPVPAAYQDEISEISLDFTAAGSYLLVRHGEEKEGIISQPAIATLTTSGSSTVLHEKRLDKPWRLSPHSLNALTLDIARLKIAERPWCEPRTVLAIQKSLRDSGPGTPFALRFLFECTEQPPQPIYLVVETPERFRILWNGRSFDTHDAGWWIDRSFRKLAVSSEIRPGQHEIILKGVWQQDTELENIYLIGNFGVEGQGPREESRSQGRIFERYTGRFQIVDLPHTVGTQGNVNLTASGFPFFVGRVMLSQTVHLSSLTERTILKLDDLQAAAAHIRVNGRHVSVLAWPPFQIGVTDALQQGENLIEIELVGTLRNLLGPHHYAGGDPDCTGPYSFSHQTRWTDDYILTPFGFAGARLVTFRDKMP